MVPCECGKQFNDLTDWKSHSYVTGHCCMYKCRKPSSAACIPGFASESGKSTFITHLTPDGTASANSKPRPSEGYYPLLAARNAPAASTLHISKCCSALSDPWQYPSSSIKHPTEGCSPLANSVWKVPVSSTRQPNLAYLSPDGTMWPAPVPLTKYETAAYYQSLNSRPALMLASMTPNPAVTSSTTPITIPAPMLRQMPSAGNTNLKSTTSPAPKIPRTPTAATSSAPGNVKTSHIMAQSPSGCRPYGCSHCKRAFWAKESLRQHYKALHPRQFNEAFGRTCDTCKKIFTADALEVHQRDKKHCYCHECKMTFESESTAVKHFETFHASQFWCCDCEQEFVSEHALDQHLNDKIHRRIFCQLCEQGFGNKPALDRHIVVEHRASVNLKRVFYPKDVHGCYICQRQFVKIKDLEQHLFSLKHRPLSDLRCVASDKCTRHFISPSALLHHLESGACCSGVTRQTINNLVQENDTERIISSGLAAQSLLEYNQTPSGYSSSTGTPVFTPTSSASSSPVAATMTDDVGQQPVPFLSLDSDPPLFATIHRALTPSTPGILTPTSPQMSSNFDILGGLPFPRANLWSHDRAPALFHCPRALAISTPHGVAPRTFTTLSGLAQHIESGACGEGLATLKKAMEFVQGRLEKMGLGSIRLLK